MKEVIIFVFCIILFALFTMGFDAYLIEKIWPSVGGKLKKDEDKTNKEE